ncbi:MAG: MFS transporter [Janthinobacterium lividum]
MNSSGASRTLRTHQAITLSLLFLAGVINFFDRSSLSIANATIRTEMHLSATQMGWLLSAFSLAYGLAQLPLAGLMQRAGTRPVLGAGLTLWSTAQLLTGLVRALPSFLVLRVLLGIGESPFYPCGVQSVRDWFPERTRGRATAVMSMSQTLGLAVAPPVLSLLILSIGWRAMFMSLGVAGLLAALAWSTLYRSRDSTEHREAPPNAVPPSSIPATGQAVLTARENAWKILLRQRMVWGMMLGFGGINYTNWLYTAWLPGYLQSARHLSLAKTGWVAAIPFLAGAFGMLTSGMATDRLARAGARLSTVHRANIVLGMTASAASTFLVAHSGSTLHAVAGISGALFFIHFAGTSGWGYVQAVSPPGLVASLSALQNFASFMIASAAPVLTGHLLDLTHSFTLALIVCSAVTLLGALSYATLAAPTKPVRALG